MSASESESKPESESESDPIGSFLLGETESGETDLGDLVKSGSSSFAESFKNEEEERQEREVLFFKYRWVWVRVGTGGRGPSIEVGGGEGGRRGGEAEEEAMAGEGGKDGRELPSWGEEVEERKREKKDCIDN